MWRILAPLGIALIAAGPTIAGAAERFTAQNGAELEAPAIASLDCDRMSDLLLEYSASGYRGPETLNEAHPDHKIFTYEDALATHYYDACQAGTAQFMDTEPIFGKGFR